MFDPTPFIRMSYIRDTNSIICTLTLTLTQTHTTKQRDPPSDTTAQQHNTHAVTTYSVQASRARRALLIERDAGDWATPTDGIDCRAPPCCPIPMSSHAASSFTGDVRGIGGAIVPAAPVSPATPPVRTRFEGFSSAAVAVGEWSVGEEGQEESEPKEPVRLPLLLTLLSLWERTRDEDEDEDEEDDEDPAVPPTTV
jgi:hypothetical protein